MLSTLVSGKKSVIKFRGIIFIIIYFDIKWKHGKTIFNLLRNSSKKIRIHVCIFNVCSGHDMLQMKKLMLLLLMYSVRLEYYILCTCNDFDLSFSFVLWILDADYAPLNHAYGFCINKLRMRTKTLYWLFILLS